MSNKKLIGSSDAAELAEATPQSIRPSFPIPESVFKTKATRGNVVKIQQKKLLEQVEPMLDEFFKVVRMKARSGDVAALKIIQEICGLSAAKGPSVVAQFYNKNEANANSRSESSATIVGERSYEDLVKRLDAREDKITTASDFIDVVAG